MNNFIASGIEPGCYQDELTQCNECKGLFYCIIEGLCIGCYDTLTKEQFNEQLEER